MKMVDMKMPATKPEPAPTTIAEDAPRYPWGLSLHLDDECMKKLSIDEMPEAGEELQLQAVVKVTSVESRDTQGGGKSRSLGLQIVKCAIGAEKPKASDQAKVIFDGK